jgi:pimeloyl-ACP methyl ester carboxylesterase
MEIEAQIPGVTSSTVRTRRLQVHVFSAGPEGRRTETGTPLVLLHGNVSSALFWDETILALAGQYRVIAPDLRGYGDTEPLPIDATRGLRDWSDDLKALAEAMQLGRFHIVGWSMGAGVAMQYAIDHPGDLLSLTLMSPLSPYGFGGTKDAQGTPTYPDFAGSGGGTVNPEFLRLLSEGDRSDSSPFTPLSTMNAFYFKTPFRVPPDREQLYVTSMLSTRTGDGFYPGDMTLSPNWPTVAPGTHGINNAMAPNYCNLSALTHIEPKPPILWVRGADDQIVSDTSFFDFGFLGQLGAVPGWPGADVFPPQPMVSQLRGVLDAYKAAGGQYWEVVIADCGHSPHIEKPQEFQAALLKHLRSSSEF